MVPTAQLKVFSPLEAFPPDERERWAAYVEAGRGLTRRQVADAEATASAARLVAGATRLGPDAALVRRAGQRVLICPLQLDLRAAMALDTFRATVGDRLVPAFVPDERTRSRLERLSGGGRPPHVLDEPFAAPLPWFVAFEPHERRFSDSAEGSGVPRLSYLTTCDQAGDRLERVIDVIEDHVEDGEGILLVLAELASWIDAFDPASVLELDYGRVAGLFTRDELEADRTCQDLWQAVEGLATDDPLGAAAAFGVARARWTHRRARQHAS